MTIKNLILGTLCALLASCTEPSPAPEDMMTRGTATPKAVCSGSSAVDRAASMSRPRLTTADAATTSAAIVSGA